MAAIDDPELDAPPSVDYPWRPPRIDDTFYQAALPELIVHDRGQEVDAAEDNDTQPGELKIKSRRPAGRAAPPSKAPPAKQSKRSGKLDKPKPGQRLKESLARITVASAFASPPEQQVWDLEKAVTTLGAEEVAAYLLFVRNVAAGLNESELHQLTSKFRVNWATAVGGYSQDSFVSAHQSSRTNSAVGGDCYPASGDDVAFAFLHANNYDIARTKLLLTSCLGAGREHSSLLRLAELKDIKDDGLDAQYPGLEDTRPGVGDDAASPVDAKGAPTMRRRLLLHERTPSLGAAAATGSSSQDARSPKQRARRSATVGASSSGEGGAPANYNLGDLGLGSEVGINAAQADAAVLMGISDRSVVPVRSEGFEFVEPSSSPLRSVAGDLDAATSSPPGLPPSALMDDPPPLVATPLARIDGPVSTGITATGSEEDEAEDAEDSAGGSKPGLFAMVASEQQKPLTEGQKVRLWKQWLADATVALQGRTEPSWDALVQLRSQASRFPQLNVFSGGGNNAALAHQVQQLCITVGTRLKQAVRWRARVRDALCDTLTLRGRAGVQTMESLVAEGASIQVELTERAVLQSIIREAKQSLKAADELLKRCNNSAAGAAAAELLHYEDAAIAGPEAEYISVPGRVTCPTGLFKRDEPAEATPSGVMTSAAGRPVRRRQAGADADDEGVESTSSGRRLKRSPNADDTGDFLTGLAALGGRKRGGALASSVPASALAYSSMYSALLTAAEKDPPVPLDELTALSREGDKLPVNLNPTFAVLAARVQRVVDLARLISEHFPNYAAHPRGPAGVRVGQGYGITEGIVGSMGVLLKQGDISTSGSVGVSSPGTVPTENQPASDSLVPSQSSADGPAPYVSYAGYHEPAWPGGVATSLRRARIPFSHVDALAKDVRETGVAFVEGEILKLYHLEALNWIARSHEAVAPRRRPTVQDLRDLIADADALPIDLSERIAVIKIEIERARKWIQAVREVVPRGLGQRTRGTAAANVKQVTVGELQALVDQVRCGLVATSPDEVEEATAMLETAEEWIARVRIALDKSRPPTNEASADRGAALLDGGSDESADENGELSLDSLTALLRAADDIPVAMEEYDLLQAEVAARKWAQRAKKALAAPQGARLETIKELLKEIKGIRMSVNSSGSSSAGPASASGRSGGAAASAVAASGLSAAGLIPANSASNVSQGEHAGKIPRINEEVEIKKAIKSAEEWQARVKKITSATGQSKRVEARKYRNLVQQASQIPVNLGHIVRTFEAVITEVDKWIVDASPALTRVRACVHLSKLLVERGLARRTIAQQPGPTDGVPVLPCHAADTDIAQQVQLIRSLPPLSLSELKDLLADCEDLSGIPEGEAELRAALESFELWVQRAVDTLPHAGLRGSAGLAQCRAAAIALMAFSKSGDKMEVDADRVGDSAEGAPAHNHPMPTASEGQPEDDLDCDGYISLDAKIPLADIRAMIDVGFALPLDASPVMDPLIAEYRKIRKWQLHAQSVLIALGAMPSLTPSELADEYNFDEVVALATGTENPFHGLHSQAKQASGGDSSGTLQSAGTWSGLAAGAAAMALDGNASPEDVKELLEGTITEVKDVRIATHEEAVVRRQLRLANWTAAAKKLAAVTAHCRERAKEAIVSGIAEASANAQQEASQTGKQASSDFLTAGFRPLAGPEPGPRTVFDIPVVSIPSQITWDPFIARRLIGPAAVAAATYWTAHVWDESRGESADVASQDAVHASDDNIDDAEFVYAYGPWSRSRRGGPRNYRRERDRLQSEGGASEHPNGETRKDPLDSTCYTGDPSYVDLAELRALLAEAEQLNIAPAALDDENDTDPLHFLDSALTGVGSEAARDQDDGVDAPGSMAVDDDAGDTDRPLDPSQRDDRQAEAPSSSQPPASGRENSEADEADDVSREGGGGETRNRRRVRRRKPVDSSVSADAVTGASREDDVERSPSKKRNRNGSQRGEGDESDNSPDSDAQHKEGPNLESEASGHRRRAVRKRHAAGFTANSSLLQAHAVMRGRLLATLHQELNGAEKWMHQAHSTLNAAGIPLAAALSLLAKGFGLAVKLDAMRLLRKCISAGQKWYGTAVLLLPPDQQAVLPPVSEGGDSVRTQKVVASVPPSMDAAEARKVFGKQFSAKKAELAARRHRVPATRIVIDSATKRLVLEDPGITGKFKYRLKALVEGKDRQGDGEQEDKEREEEQTADSDAAGRGDDNEVDDSDGDVDEVTVKRPSLDKIESAIAQAATCKVQLPLAKRLRAEVRAGRKWLDDVRKSGFEQGNAPLSTLKELILQADSLWVDMSEVVEKMLQSCALYCVCQQPYSAPMIECPGCKMVFHYECVGFKGLGGRQALKAEARAFRCPACACRSAMGHLVSVGLQALHYIHLQHGEQAAHPERWADAAAVARKPWPSIDNAIRSIGKPLFGTVTSQTEVATTDGTASKAVLDFRMPPPLSSLAHPRPSVAPGEEGERQPPAHPSLPMQYLGVSYNLLPWLDEKALTWIDNVAAVLEPPSFFISATLRAPSHLRNMILAAAGLPAHPHILKLVSAVRALLWGSYSIPVVARVCKIADLLRVYAAAKQVPLPSDMSALHHIVHLAIRGVSWKAEALRTLSAKGPANLGLIENLLKASRRIPVDFAEEEPRLEAVVADGGRAWCVCKGVSSGFMIGCDFCDEWYHGKCVGVSEADTRPSGVVSSGDASAPAASVAQVDVGKPDADAGAGGSRKKSNRKSRKPKDKGPADDLKDSIETTEFVFRCPACCQRVAAAYPFAARMRASQVLASREHQKQKVLLGALITTLRKLRVDIQQGVQATTASPSILHSVLTPPPAVAGSFMALLDSSPGAPPAPLPDGIVPTPLAGMPPSHAQAGRTAQVAPTRPPTASAPQGRLEQAVATTTVTKAGRGSRISQLRPGNALEKEWRMKLERRQQLLRASSAQVQPPLPLHQDAARPTLLQPTSGISVSDGAPYVYEQSAANVASAGPSFLQQGAVTDQLPATDTLAHSYTLYSGYQQQQQHHQQDVYAAGMGYQPGYSTQTTGAYNAYAITQAVPQNMAMQSGEHARSSQPTGWQQGYVGPETLTPSAVELSPSMRTFADAEDVSKTRPAYQPPSAVATISATSQFTQQAYSYYASNAPHDNGAYVAVSTPLLNPTAVDSTVVVEPAHRPAWENVPTSAPAGRKSLRGRSSRGTGKARTLGGNGRGRAIAGSSLYHAPAAPVVSADDETAGQQFGYGVTTEMNAALGDALTIPGPASNRSTVRMTLSGQPVMRANDHAAFVLVDGNDVGSSVPRGADAAATVRSTARGGRGGKARAVRPPTIYAPAGSADSTLAVPGVVKQDDPPPPVDAAPQTVGVDATNLQYLSVGVASSEAPCPTADILQPPDVGSAVAETVQSEVTSDESQTPNSPELAAGRGRPTAGKRRRSAWDDDFVQ